MAEETVKTEVKSASTETAKSMAENPTTPEATKTTDVAVELQETKVKQAFLDKFKVKKKKGEAGKEKDEEQTQDPTQDAAEAIYKELAEIKGADYWVIRIRKKTVLLISGLAIFLMWVVILGGWAVERYKPEWAFWNPQSETTQELVPTATPAPEALIKIRIRDNHSDPQIAQAIRDRLQSSGFTQMELVDDHESDYVGIMIITKVSDPKVKQKIETILAETYPISSPSAELTEDSDFGAVILVGDPTPSTATGSANLSNDN